MSFSISRRGAVRVITFLIAAFLIVCGLAGAAYGQARQYRRYLQTSYIHAFSELTTAVSEIDTALQKGMYATSPAMISTLCTEVFGKAMAAQMSLGELPYANVELEQTAAFVAKVGDYAYALSRAAAINGGYSGQDLDNLAALSRQATQLADQLGRLEADIQNGIYTLDDVPAAEERLATVQEDGSAPEGGYQEIEGQFSELPTLIYDGPFSDHIQSRSPAMLEGREPVSESEAREIAAAFVGLRPEIFTLISTVEGRIPAWSFSAAVDGGELTVQVSRTGGLVLNLFNSRPAGETALSHEEGVEAARAFLQERGFACVKESYYMEQDGVLTVNFASVQEDVICYPDLIKVAVALDNGRIVGFESEGYLMNHTVRELPAVTLSLAQAQLKVSSQLKQLAHQLAVIPTTGENELLCYEFKCETQDGQHYIVYVNAQSGNEERMFLLLED